LFKLQEELVFVSLQLEARLLTEIEGFAQKKGIESTEQALIQVVEEFFREHRDGKAA
jgi:hypothetical protein